MRSHKFFSLSLLMLLCVFTLAGCSSSDKKGTKGNPTDFEAERTAEDLFDSAEEALSQGRYGEATVLFDEVERQHPYSNFSQQAQLQSAFASYKGQQYDAAIIALDRFVDLYPGSDDVPYALYLKGLSYYEQISDVRRDQEMTSLALNAFNTLISRFPDSTSARDASLKRDLTLDHLAGKEMEVGRYYLKRGHVNAAINRFKVVIEKYDTTTHVAEALHRLVESYLIIGLEAQAVQVASVLGYNYPGSVWYERTYKLLDPKQRQKILENRSWFDRTVDSLLRAE